jgi:hypothetical protein
MTKVPVPMTVATKISADAVRFARESMQGLGYSQRSLEAVVPYPGEGLVGIKTSQRYLMYQERGTRPYLMYWVQGRTISMGCKQGDGPHFRRGGHVGEPGFVDIPHVGKVWRDQRWRHPGIQGKGFLQAAVQRAVQENQPAIKAWARGMIGGGRR